MWVIVTFRRMALVQLDKKHRVTLPKKLRKKFRIIEGQKFYLVPYGDDFLLKPVPKDPEKKLDDMIGKIKFDREARRRAESWIVEQSRKKS